MRRSEVSPQMLSDGRWRRLCVWRVAVEPLPEAASMAIRCMYFRYRILYRCMIGAACSVVRQVYTVNTPWTIVFCFFPLCPNRRHRLPSGYRGAQGAGRVRRAFGRKALHVRLPRRVLLHGSLAPEVIYRFPLFLSPTTQNNYCKVIVSPEYILG